MIHILKMAKGPIVRFLMDIGIFWILSQQVGIGAGDECLAVGPPEFHVMPIFLDGRTVQRSEVQ